MRETAAGSYGLTTGYTESNVNDEYSPPTVSGQNGVHVKASGVDPEQFTFVHLGLPIPFGR